jgi:hypothetical protein
MPDSDVAKKSTGSEAPNQPGALFFVQGHSRQGVL